jgi:hypothetical protein
MKYFCMNMNCKNHISTSPILECNEKNCNLAAQLNDKNFSEENGELSLELSKSDIAKVESGRLTLSEVEKEIM